MELEFDIDHNSVDLKISRDIYIRILGKALEQTKKDTDEMKEALTSHDFDKVQVISHRWKGDYANLRISGLSEIARQINVLSKSSPEQGPAQKLYDEFKDMFNQLDTIYNNLKI